MSKVLHWNGKDLPSELRDVPEGRYELMPVDALPELTPEQERGLERAMDSLDADRGVPVDEARQRMAARFK